MEFSFLDARPVLVAIAGPNGAGKSTFYHAHLAPAGLPFVNADVISREMNIEPYLAAEFANRVRHELVQRGESFVFETVFSDPVGEKVAFLKEASKAGYSVALCFIGISNPRVSEERVAMRVSQGGHDVPDEKLRSRFPRILANLAAAIDEIALVIVYDNDDLSKPFRLVAVFEHGRQVTINKPIPNWLSGLVERNA